MLKKATRYSQSKLPPISGVTRWQLDQRLLSRSNAAVGGPQSRGSSQDGAPGKESDPNRETAQTLFRQLIEQLSTYDWASLSDDVLGSIFEHLIPREEQLFLGQFYTPRPVADLLVASTIDGEG